MRLFHFQDCKNNAQKLANKYYELIGNLEKNIENYDVYNINDEQTLINQRDSFIDIYSKLSELQYLVSLLRNKDELISNDDSTKTPIRVFNSMAKDWLNRIQFQYLYPILLKLSQFSEKESIKRDNEAENKSKRRDWIVFFAGILLGYIVNYTTPWVQTYFGLPAPPENKIINPIKEKSPEQNNNDTTLKSVINGTNTN